MVSIISPVLPHIVTLFDNPYMFSLLGLIGLSVIILAFKILTRF